jgi:gliding motility-associated-like protein
LDSINQNPQHIFQASGDYFVTLTTYNDKTGCKYEFTRKVEVRIVIAAFTPSPIFGCAPLNVLFNSSASKNAAGYKWDFGDGVTLGITPNPFHIYQRGSYKAMLVVFDKNGCSDTAYKAINAYQPIAGFSLDKLQACTPGIITIADTSKPDGTPIVSYSWKFGDGGTSNIKNPGKHTYTQAGTYQITLYIVDQAGCTDSMVSLPINIVKPFSNFSVSDQTICKGDSVQLLDFSSGIGTLTYLWNFGDGVTSTLSSPFHTYNTAGSFQVSLQVKDGGGCPDTKTMSNFISVHDKPKAAFTVDKQKGCSLPGIFTNTSTAPSGGVTYLWSFGDGGLSAANTPVHKYTIPGKYAVQLIATYTANGCADTTLMADYITIYNSSLSLSSTPSEICKGDTIHFQITNVINAIPTFWDFGDGYSLTDSVSMNVNHVYNNMNSGGPITAYLYYIDTTLDASCKSFDTTIFNVRDVIAKFSISGQSGCMPFAVTFTDQSNNPNHWSWDFGDGTFSGAANPPLHPYPNPGNYTVSLAILNDQWGCMDTIKNQITVHPLPAVNALNDGPVCLQDSVQLHASGGIIYTWTPVNDFSYPAAALSSDPYVIPKSNTTYKVTVTDVNGCVNSTHTDVNVIFPAVSNLPSDSTVIVGTKIILDPHISSGGYTFSWSPADHLSCTDCASPEAQVLDSITYVVTITDINGCFDITDTIVLHVIRAYAIDLPRVFTPNGDGKNDIVYAKGWGIKKLIEFKIFNRWGEMVFESHDMKNGWDGYYKGSLQNNETYVYIITAESFKGDMISKKGNITLLK